MKHFRHLTPVSLIISGLLVVGLVSGIKPSPAYAAKSSQRLVSIYADGVQRTVSTNSKTVGEALERAGVELSKYDRSEPSVDSEITTDNFNVNIYRAQPVMIVDGNKVKKTITSYKTPRQIVERAGFSTDPADQFEQTIERDFLRQDFVGLKVTIHRAKLVSFDLYGTLAQIHTASPTVRALLHERGIKLNPKDKLSVPIDAKTYNGMIIDISRPDQRVITKTEAIPFTEKQIQDVNRPIGYSAIRTPGKNGVKLVTYQDMVNGKKTPMTPIQSLIKLNPVQQVVVVGAKVTPTPKANFTGDLSEAFARLRACEAGGNYATNTGNGYYGAYQYDIGTWANYGGYRLPSDAPPQVQDQKALITYQARGWSPWPSCGANL